jgi:Na+-transporting methylmalonyl-CoA/oxaloacetate decarboxylase gamma subunit
MHITTLTLSEAIAYAAVGMVVVLSVLTLLAVLITLISKVIAVAESRRKVSEAAGRFLSTLPASEQRSDEAALQAPPLKAEVTLIDTDEETAAVLMAIVADQTQIPLNKLKFNSIKLLEDSK